MSFSKTIIPFLFFIVLLSVFTAQGNNEIDSLTQLLTTNNQEITQNERVTILLKLSAKAENHFQSLEYADKAYDLANAIKDYPQQIEAQKYKGLFLYELGGRKEAVNELFKAVTLCDEYNEPSRKALLFLIIGNIKLEMEHGDYNEYLEKSEALFLDQKNMNGLVKVSSTIAKILIDNGEYEKAKIKFYEILSLKHPKKDPYSNWNCQVQLSRIHSRTNQRDSALYYLNSSNDPQFLRTTPRKNITWNLNAAEVYQDFEEYDKALEYAEIALGFIRKTDAVNSEIECMRIIAEINERANNFQAALAANSRMAHLRDSINKIESEKEYEKFQTLFDIGQKESDLKLAEAKNQEFEHAATVRGYQTILYIALGLVAVLMLVVIVLYYKREKDKLESKVEQRDQYISRMATDLLEKQKALKNVGNDSIAQVHTHDTNLYEELVDIEQSFFLRMEELYPELSEGERKVSALIRTNKSSKDIAEIMNLTSRSVDTYRSRIRKKMGLESSDSLTNALKKI